MGWIGVGNVGVALGGDVVGFLAIAYLYIYLEGGEWGVRGYGGGFGVGKNSISLFVFAFV